MSTISHTGNLRHKARPLQITTDWYEARNTLTHRLLGPISTGTIKMDIGGMKDGDRAGLGLLRDVSAYIGVWRTGNTFTVNMVNNITIFQLQAPTPDVSWVTTSTGTTTGTVVVPRTPIWLRIISNSTASDLTLSANSATFWFSTNGKKFKQLGPSFTDDTDWHFFPGQR
jgi:hypothetical protein